MILHHHHLYSHLTSHTLSIEQMMMIKLSRISSKQWIRRAFVNKILPLHWQNSIPVTAQKGTWITQLTICQNCIRSSTMDSWKHRTCRSKTKHIWNRILLLVSAYLSHDGTSSTSHSLILGCYTSIKAILWKIVIIYHSRLSRYTTPESSLGNKMKHVLNYIARLEIRTLMLGSLNVLKNTTLLVHLE